MSAMASQIAGVSIVFSTVCPGADQRKQQRSVSLVFVRGGFPSQSARRKPFSFDVVIMYEMKTFYLFVKLQCNACFFFWDTLIYLFDKI